MNSLKNSLIAQDWAKIGKGALIACGGALLTYLSSIIPNIDFGIWTPIVMAFWSIIINIGQKYLSQNNYPII